MLRKTNRYRCWTTKGCFLYNFETPYIQATRLTLPKNGANDEHIVNEGHLDRVAGAQRVRLGDTLLKMQSKSQYSMFFFQSARPASLITYH